MENVEKKLLVSSTPHIRGKDTIEGIMKDVIIALVPATIGSFVFFGLRAVIILAISIISCLLFEALFRRLTKQEMTLNDLSAVVTGILLALNLPSATPFWIPILGAFFAIVVIKQLFGGLGQNFMNPALGARAFLLLSFTQEMTTWVVPLKNQFSLSIDAVSSSTPLAVLEMGSKAGSLDIQKAFIGNISGSMGETSALLLLIGGIYLIYKKVITWQIPVSFLATVVIISSILGRNGLYEILVGGIMIGAIFMATDYASSPITPIGKIVMGVGCGLITVLLRIYGTYPEACSFAILFMNLATPLIERYTKPKVFGTGRANINE